MSRRAQGRECRSRRDDARRVFRAGKHGHEREMDIAGAASPEMPSPARDVIRIGAEFAKFDALSEPCIDGLVVLLPVVCLRVAPSEVQFT